MQVTDGVVCVLTTQVGKFFGYKLVSYSHTNRPAFLSTEKEIIKAEHIIKQIYITKDFIMYPQNNQVESNNSKNANQIANITNDGKMMSSREIANLTEKNHKEVLRDIRRMLEDLGDLEDSANLRSPQNSEKGWELSTYTTSQNKQQPEYLLNFDLTMTLIAGYNVVLRNRIIKRWQELEKAAAKPSEPDLREFCIQQFGVPKNYAEALTAMAELETQRQALEDKVSQQHQILIEQDLQIKKSQQSVDALEAISASDEDLKFRQVSKILGVKEPDLRAWLIANRWTQLVNGKQTSRYESEKQGLTKLKYFYKTGKNGGYATHSTLFFTPKGVVALAKELQNIGVKISSDQLLKGFQDAVLENKTLKSDKIF